MRVKGEQNKKTKAKVKNKKVQETTEHNKLKLAIAEIVSTCGFKLDTETTINFTGNRNEKGELIDERSIDVVAYGNNKNKRFLIIFECKGGSDIKGIQSKISSWEADIEKVKKGEARVIYSDRKAIKDSDFKGVDEIRIRYVFGNSIVPERFESIGNPTQFLVSNKVENQALWMAHCWDKVFPMPKITDANCAQGLTFLKLQLLLMSQSHLNLKPQDLTLTLYIPFEMPNSMTDFLNKIYA